MSTRSVYDHFTIVPENKTTTEEPQNPGGAWVPFAEPVPDWEEASQTWGVWWYIHVYGVGVLFFVLTIFTFINIIALFVTVKLPQKAYFISLNILVCIFATERGIFMFIDPYNIKGTLHPTIAYLFLSIGLPCMTSAFYLIFIAWMKATKLQRVYTIHKTKTMIIIIVLHFIVSIIFDLVAGYTIHAIYLLICCQVCFILLSCALSIMYFYLYIRIYKSTVKTRRDLVKMSNKTHVNINETADNTVFNTDAKNIVYSQYSDNPNTNEDHVVLPSVHVINQEDHVVLPSVHVINQEDHVVLPSVHVMKQELSSDGRCLSYTYGEDTEKNDSAFRNDSIHNVSSDQVYVEKKKQIAENGSTFKGKKKKVPTATLR